MIQQKDKERRLLAHTLATHEPGAWWSEQDIHQLLDELEIEVGEGTNRFLHDDERQSYCAYLAKTLQSIHRKSPYQIYEMIVWLWSTWEAISRATGKSWWSISEQEKYDLSLMVDHKGNVDNGLVSCVSRTLNECIDQRLKSKFKYFDNCDRVFAYIHEEEGEEEDLLPMEGSIYY